MRLSIIASALPLWSPSWIGRVSGQGVATNVTFFHINDHHSHYEDFSFDISDPIILPLADLTPLLNNRTTAVETIRIYYGGFSRMVSYMKQREAAVLEEGNSDDVLKLHAGDAMTGTFFYTAFGPAVDAAAMNVVQFDAFVLGNHEFDDGDTNLADFINLLSNETSVLSANLNPADSSALRRLVDSEIVRPYTIKTLSSGEVLGICGITIKASTEQSSFPDDGTTIDDEIASAMQCVKDLQAQDVNKIVLLTHIGYSHDSGWLDGIDGIDVVIGGHSHSLLAGQGFNSLGYPTRGEYATVTDGKCIVTAWEYVRVLGELTVEFDASGNVLSCSGGPKMMLNPDDYTIRSPSPRENLPPEGARLVTEALLGLEDTPFVVVERDSETETVLAPFFEASDAARNRVIGSSSESLCHTYTKQDPVCPDRELENCLSGVICNLVSQSFLYNVPTADVSIQNRGGCRNDILVGDITLQAVFDVLPFSNTLTTFEMTGAEIKALLEDAVNFFLELGGGEGSYPFAAGLRYDIDYTQEFGSRISDLEVNRRLEEDWGPIDVTATYVVVTHSFLAAGKDGYYTFTNDNIAATFSNTFIEYGQSFVNFIENQGTVGYPPLSEFSTQRIVTSDGEVCDVTPTETTSVPTKALSSKMTTKVPTTTSTRNDPTSSSPDRQVLSSLLLIFVWLPWSLFQ